MTPVGRFAPTPSGRMHLGNLFSALLAWLSIRSQGGELVLRMEDLDPQRTGDGSVRTSPGWGSPGTGRPNPKAAALTLTWLPSGCWKPVGSCIPATAPAAACTGQMLPILQTESMYTTAGAGI